MTTRGTGQGGFLARAGEAISVLRGAGLLSASFARTMAPSVKAYGTTAAAGFVAAANRTPDAPAIIDENGAVSFAELQATTNGLARALAERGVKAGDAVGLFARNHRGFVESMVALDKLGANSLLLNTGFAAPQLAEVSAREGAKALLFDAEFAGIVDDGDVGDIPKLSTELEREGDYETIHEAAAGQSSGELPAPPVHGRVTVLTSGTTGTPKGAQRTPKRGSLDTMIGVFGRLPLKASSRALVSAPVFHSWGMFHLIAAAQLGCTVCLRRRFDPEDTLAAIDRLKPRVLAVVPVMMQRMLELPPDVIAKYDVSSLELVGSSGSALPGELAVRWMDTFGDNLYNFYGSTEVAHAAIAQPDELRSAPGTAGRPPRGVTVKILDADGNEVPAGTAGRIFVANDNQFDGYTGGGNKEVIAGMMSSGDVGHFDEDGLLFVDGRDDDMIVSGGENVFPREVEDLLVDHPAIEDAAVIGVPDDQFGQRLRAFVVKRAGVDVDSDSLAEHVRSNLARYKVPREFVFLDELPRNPTGKILKRILKEHP